MKILIRANSIFPAQLVKKSAHECLLKVGAIQMYSTEQMQSELSPSRLSLVV